LFVDVCAYEKVRLVEVKTNNLIEGGDGDTIIFGMVCRGVEGDVGGVRVFIDVYEFMLADEGVGEEIFNCCANVGLVKVSEHIFDIERGVFNVHGRIIEEVTVNVCNEMGKFLCAGKGPCVGGAYRHEIGEGNRCKA
jgi:hypothetical protein